MPTRKKMSRDMRKNLVEGLVYRSAEPMRVLDIARAMGMVRSPYLCDLINELVADNRLEVTEVELAPDLLARAYKMPARRAQ